MSRNTQKAARTEVTCCFAHHQRPSTGVQDDVGPVAPVILWFTWPLPTLDDKEITVQQTVQQAVAFDDTDWLETARRPGRRVRFPQAVGFEELGRKGYVQLEIQGLVLNPRVRYDASPDGLGTGKCVEHITVPGRFGTTGPRYLPGGRPMGDAR